MLGKLAVLAVICVVLLVIFGGFNALTGYSLLAHLPTAAEIGDWLVAIGNGLGM